MEKLSAPDSISTDMRCQADTEERRQEADDGEAGAKFGGQFNFLVSSSAPCRVRAPEPATKTCKAATLRNDAASPPAY
jgi:hypothetical protein